MKKFFTLFILVLGLVQIGWAQPPNQHRSRPRQPHLKQGFFPPEMVMQNQQKIGLTTSQQQYISNEMQRTQAAFNKLQWALHREMEKMHTLTQQTKVNEKAALLQLEKILALERQIKKQQLRLMIRIKNQLTDKQKATLKKIAPPHRHKR
ncbi:Spy/CpxP family protein refolding chaperone [uncultured Microscilla sp.]|uniref:Spy/CpxP family protein refolding chaperone n=1 Tax=uncultured Microscilla sp. TaxID=432653 RepID=UPI002619B495|nr:periplasmic heavy metal sensor [uncultured Microscilla sp.]